MGKVASGAYYETPGPVLAHTDWLEVERTGRCKLSDADRATIAELLLRFQNEAARFRDLPRLVEVHKAYKKLGRAAINLISALQPWVASEQSLAHAMSPTALQAAREEIRRALPFAESRLPLTVMPRDALGSLYAKVSQVLRAVVLVKSAAVYPKDESRKSVIRYLVQVEKAGAKFLKQMDRLERSISREGEHLDSEDLPNQSAARFLRRELRKLGDGGSAARPDRVDAIREFAEVEGDLGLLRMALDRAIETVGKFAASPSRTAHWPLIAFIRDLGAVYARCGGVVAANKSENSRTWSPYVRFVAALLAHVSDEGRPTSALGPFIDEMRKDGQFVGPVPRPD